MSRRERVYEADVAALEGRLRTILAAGGTATEQEVARYETDRARLLDLIGDQMREQREYDAAMARLRAEMEPEHDADGWVPDGYEAAHQAHLDSLGHVDADVGTEQPATARDELRRVEVMINAPYRQADSPPADLDALDRQIREVQGGLLIDDEVEPWTAARGGQVPVLDEAGDQR